MSSNCNDCGNSQFQYSATLAGGAPNLGDSYVFQVTYSDTSSDTVAGTVTAFGGTGAVVGPSDLPTLTSPASGTTAASDQPTFSWTDPTLTNPGNYYYSFYLCCSSNNNIWQIPGNNSKSGGFSDTVDSITWGTDPTGGGSTPSVGSLTSTDSYSWSIQISDGSNNNGNRPNQAESSVYFVAP